MFSQHRFAGNKAQYSYVLSIKIKHFNNDLFLTRPKIWPLRPAKSKISRSRCSEYSLCTQRITKDLRILQEVEFEQTECDAQSDMILRYT